MGRNKQRRIYSMNYIVNSMSLATIFMLIIVGNGKTVFKEGYCKPSPSCKECILSHPSCAWCKDLNFTKVGEADSSRCGTQEQLLKRGCDQDQIMDPRSSYKILEDTPLSDNSDKKTVTQLAPQKIQLTLRPGERKSFTVRFKRAEGYPVDLYYLMDLSYSMKDDLEKVKRLGNDLLAALKNVTNSVKIGFGSFVDKTVLPFVSTKKSKLLNPCPDRMEQCQPPFSFKHVLALTDNATEFEIKVSEQNISGNLDSPEGGFDAIMQAAVCTDQIGWRNVTRLLVFTSDDTFHMAGDGKLGGIYFPSDGRCHLDKNGVYEKSNFFDYPSVGHVANILSTSNIQPIFAVTGSILSTYQELSQMIPKSVVGELKEDSSNVIQLISEAYNDLSSTITLVHLQVPPEIQIVYSSHCNNGSVFGQTRGECSNVKINELVKFDVSVQAPVGLCQQDVQSFKVKVLGFSEELSVEVRMVCDCNCQDEEPFSRKCSDGNGNFSCGVCSCAKSRLGKACECEQVGYQNDLDAGCRANGSQLCSGKGRCECGACVCNTNVRGEHCECDDTSCERHDGLLCGGKSQGTCSCGNCKCTANYTGSACGCSTDMSECSIDGVECSGHGHCECNRCICDPGYFEKLCTKCPGCENRCQRYRSCVECQVFGTGLLGENCTLVCSKVNLTMVERQDEAFTWCTEKAGDSLVTFSFEEEGDNVFINVLAKQEVADQTQNIVIGLVLGIVLIGLLLIIAYRITVEIYDRKEYARFEKERTNVEWKELNNPLYKSATTTVVNPKFSMD
ncbi:integrin beta-7 [Lissotriton helveticus]